MKCTTNLSWPKTRSVDSPPAPVLDQDWVLSTGAGTPQGVSWENFMLDRKSLSLCVVRSLIVSALAVSVWVASTSSAQAETMIAADFEARVPLNIDDVSSGPAFGIR